MGIAECALTPEEAAQLATVLAKIQMLSGDAKPINPKASAWANLALVIVTLYLPRFLAWRIRMKTEHPARGKLAVVVMGAEPAATPAN